MQSWSLRSAEAETGDATMLRRFVEAGGRAVAEARLAWNDERGYAAEVIPGAGLHEVFGVRERRVWMRPDVQLTVAEGDPLTTGLGGKTLRGTLYATSVDVLSQQARVLATTEGEPAVVRSRYGKGETLFIGSYLGWGNHPTQQRENTEFVRRLAEWAGVEKPVATSFDGTRQGPSLLARLQQSERGYLLFLINPDSSAREVAVTVRLPSGAYELRELTGDTSRAATTRAGVLQLDTRIAAQDAQVWSIR